MRYADFENIMSMPRMNRYKQACGGDVRKAMTLYRKNLKLSQELFIVISCFEIALRNAIDKNYLRTLGSDWLRNAIASGGCFDDSRCAITQRTIDEEIRSLRGPYTHHKLVAGLGFGFWRYMFGRHQYRLAGSTLLRILPNRPPSSRTIHYNQNYVFQELKKINNIRNRIAHHEPICFQANAAVKDTSYVREHYKVIVQLFYWMGINEKELLYGLDHVLSSCNKIDTL